MGRDLDPRHLPWKYSGLNCGSNDLIRQPKNNSMVFPSYTNPFGCSRNEIVPFDGFATHSFARHPLNSESVGGTDQKRFFVFDQSGDRTSLIYSSVVGPPFWNADPSNVKTSDLGSFGAGFNRNSYPIVRSNETNVFDAHGSEEMCEDSEEIDALLYSSYDNRHEQDVEEVSTGHSPLDITRAPNDVATATKKRRLDKDLMDTASSARPGHENNNDALSCVRGGVECSSKQLKRKRIHETVGVLRRIIPDGKGKDTATVLDEAIRYLKSLKLKVKGLGAAF